MEHLINFLGSLQKFFNDFVGAVAPAVVLATGIWIVPGVKLHRAQVLELWGEYIWVAAIALLFGAGHLLLGISSLLRELVVSLKSKPEATTPSAPLTRARALLDAVLPLPERQLAEENVRNIAMTMSTTGEEQGRRFIFLSEFCSSLGVAVLLIGATWLGSALFATDDPVTKVVEAPALGEAALIFFASLLACIVLTRRGTKFRARAMHLPFDALLGDVASHEFGLTQEAAAPEAASETQSTASDRVVPGAPAPATLPVV